MPGRAETDLQEDRLALDQLVENLEGRWEEHLDKGPVQQRPEQLAILEASCCGCHYQIDLIVGKGGAWRGRLTPMI
jgi:hypothetical protein